MCGIGAGPPGPGPIRGTPGGMGPPGTGPEGGGAVPPELPDDDFPEPADTKRVHRESLTDFSRTIVVLLQQAIIRVMRRSPDIGEESKEHKEKFLLLFFKYMQQL